MYAPEQLTVLAAMKFLTSGVASKQLGYLMLDSFTDLFFAAEINAASRTRWVW